MKNGRQLPQNIPNMLTALRVILIPIFVAVFYAPFHWRYGACAFIFALACATDWLDGYLARTLKQFSPFGEFLDPVADKLIVSTALVLLVSQHDLPYLALPAAIIIGREIVVSALREWMSELGKRASLAVTYVTKVKTTLQMLAIFLLLLYHPEKSWVIKAAGYIFLYLSALLTFYTMFAYVRTAWPDLFVKKA